MELTEQHGQDMGKASVVRWLELEGHGAYVGDRPRGEAVSILQRFSRPHPQV